MKKFNFNKDADVKDDKDSKSEPKASKFPNFVKSKDGKKDAKPVKDADEDCDKDDKSDSKASKFPNFLKKSDKKDDVKDDKKNEHTSFLEYLKHRDNKLDEVETSTADVAMFKSPVGKVVRRKSPCDCKDKKKCHCE